MNITAHVAQNDANRTSAVDRRMTRHAGYEVSQRKRKRIEESFGWMKIIGMLKKVKLRGLEKVGWLFTFVGAALQLEKADSERRTPAERQRKVLQGHTEHRENGAANPAKPGILQQAVRRTRMLKVSRMALMLLTLSLTMCAVAQSHYQHLVWSDEFNAANGSVPDSQKWTVTNAPGAFSDYNLPQNAQIKNGNLVITASNVPYVWNGVRYQYRTAQLSSRNKFSQLYGRFEVRMKVAYGQGIATAFWILGDDYPKVGWPACGEIDVVENIGKEPSTIHGSVHGPGYVGSYLGTGYTLSQRQRVANDFHIYAVEWDPGAVRFYMDNSLYATYTPQDLPPGTTWLFDHPFFLIFNIYVGGPGSWEGAPDNTTVFPQKVFVDYVRVYQ